MTVANHLTDRDLKQPVPEGLTPAAEKHWKYQRYIKDYLRCVASVDDNVGRVLDYLDAEGLAADTCSPDTRLSDDMNHINPAKTER